MAIFAYKAKSNEGKVMKGKIDSVNKKEALDELKKMGLVVFEVESLNTVLNKEIYITSPVKQKEFVIFLRQFATLLSAGILLVNAIDLLAVQSTNRVLKEALEEISAEVKDGMSLSEAMKKYPKLFPELLVHMIQSAEVSGRLEEVLGQMATYYEKQYRIKQKVSTALTYPLVVGALAIVITIFLLVFIVPVFGDMFASMGEELPLMTQMVLQVSAALQTYWWVILLLFIGLAFLFIQLSKREEMAYYFDYVQLKIPILGEFIRKSILARMTQTLSSLLNSSVPILQAIEVTSQTVGNRVVEKVLIQAQATVEQGESLAKPFEEHWVFPPLISQMIQVGESSGALDEMLKKIAEIYDQEVEEASNKLQSMIEPVLIIFLTGVVGMIVLSVIIPMFSLFSAF